MKCPRCSAEIDIPVAHVSEEGTSAVCPACNGKFPMHRESFGGRAFRRTGEVACASCGSSLGPQMHCQSCGVGFPDYVVPGEGGKGSRKKVVRSRSSLFKKRSTMSMSDLPTLQMAQDESAAPKPQQTVKGKAFGKTGVIAASVVLLVVAALAGGAFYLKQKAETEYIKNFAMAAYGIQVGADRSDKACQRIAVDWKRKIDAGQNGAPRLSADEERELGRIKEKLDSVKSKLAEEPKKLAGSNDKLARLESRYEKMRSLAQSPGTSLPAFTESVNKAGADYKTAAGEFKSGLQPELMEELRSAALKFRGLRPLLK